MNVGSFIDQLDQPVTNGTPAWVLVVLGGMTMIGTIVTAWFAKGAHKNSREANEAVNMRHLRGVDENGKPVTPRLYDSVLDISSRQVAMADDIGDLKENQQKIKSTVDIVQAYIHEVSGHVSTLDRDLKRHIGDTKEKIDSFNPERVAEAVFQRLQSKEGEQK